MKKIDCRRVKAKIIRKIRWYYLKYTQKSKRHLLFYKSYRYYLRHKGKRIAEAPSYHCAYLTKEVHPGAGIGDQLASWLSGYYYAGRLGTKYAYSRLYPDKWENFMGLSDGEVMACELRRKQGYRKVRLPWFDEKRPEEWEMIHGIMDSYAGRKVVFYLELDQIYSEQYGVMEDFRKKFNRAHPQNTETLVYQKDQFNIAIHIRRGDIELGQETGEIQLTQRWLGNDYYITVLDQILKQLQGRNTAIYLFSQGDRENFKEFTGYQNLHYCMDMSATDSFLHMVRADALIISKSSFSYKPALLSEGIRICPTGFWHGYPDNEKWIVVDPQKKESMENIGEKVKKALNSV